MAMKPKGPEEETEMEDREAGDGKGDRKRGGKIEKKKEKAMERKRGGRIHGKKAESRPDRRGRSAGGAMADKSPFTEASKMSKPAFERKESD